MLEIHLSETVKTPLNLARNRLIVALLALTGMAGVGFIAFDAQHKNLVALEKIQRLTAQNSFLTKKVRFKANQVKGLKLEAKAKYSVRLIYQWASEANGEPPVSPLEDVAASDPITTGSVMAAAQDPRSTLRIDDLIPRWREPKSS